MLVIYAKPRPRLASNEPLPPPASSSTHFPARQRFIPATPFMHGSLYVCTPYVLLFLFFFSFLDTHIEISEPQIRQSCAWIKRHLYLVPLPPFNKEAPPLSSLKPPFHHPIRDGASLAPFCSLKSPHYSTELQVPSRLFALIPPLFVPSLYFVLLHPFSTCPQEWDFAFYSKLYEKKKSYG